MNRITTSSNESTVYKIGNTMIILSTLRTAGGNSGSVESVAVTFPEQFTSAPNVYVTAASSAPYTKARNVTVADKSVSGFTAYVYRMDDNYETINYLAIGEKDEN